MIKVFRGGRCVGHIAANLDVGAETSEQWGAWDDEGALLGFLPTIDEARHLVATFARLASLGAATEA